MVDPLSSKKHWVLFILCLAQFSLSADVSNLSISTATLVSIFDTDVASIQLLGSIQPLVGAAFMLSSSMLGLMIGWRRLLILGACIGLCSSLGFLIIKDIKAITFLVRPFAGIAAAMMLPAVLALVVAHFPKKKRALGFGLMAAATGLAAAIIPLFSGWVYDNLSWKWSFFAISTCYGATLIGSIIMIKPIDSNNRTRFDITGSILCSVSIMIMFLGLIKMPHWGAVITLTSADIPSWLNFSGALSPAFTLFLIGVTIFGFFIKQQLRFERQHGVALFPISWLTHSATRNGFIILSLMYVILGGSSFVIVTYLQVAVNLSSSHSGAIVLLFSASMILSSVLTPILFSHSSTRALSSAAFIGIITAGAILILSSHERGIQVGFYLGMMLLGGAMGTLASQCPVIITKALGERDAEQSGGLQATVRNMGLVLGISLLGGVNQLALDDKIRSNSLIIFSYPAPFTQSMNETSRIPYVNDNKVESIAHSFGLSQQQKAYLVRTNATARVKGFNSALLLLILVALVGLRFSLKVDRESLTQTS
ncbi:MFS transporter [Vibrio chagasii]|uniref:MFS transporter n=1 Tax=Vibrio chagasii TaxID=170679 RepID=UPI003BB75131